MGERKLFFWLNIGVLILFCAAGTAVLRSPVVARESGPVVIPPPAQDEAKADGGIETAVLAGGCFWGMQGVFEHVKGVTRVLAGYAGGERDTASYPAVSTGRTGHAESIQVSYDPAQISYGEILRVYFSVAHDPTQLNRQGPDIGSQYRSDVFYASASQRRIAAAYIAQLNKAGAFPRPIATRVDALRGFFAAEKYHQDFLIRHPTYPYIVYNDLPKIDNLKRLYPEIYRADPVTVAVTE